MHTIKKIFENTFNYFFKEALDVILSLIIASRVLKNIKKSSRKFYYSFEYQTHLSLPILLLRSHSLTMLFNCYMLEDWCSENDKNSLNNEKIRRQNLVKNLYEY